jgi:uncharacterized repeat protein (TIGR03803 family)
VISRFYVVAFTVILGLSALAPAQTFTTLYAFTGGSDGGYPSAALIQERAGNLYGTTSYGGTYQRGVAFKVDATGNETVLHEFARHGDGALPYAPLLQDSQGNLYGTTRKGGRRDGVVFKIGAAGSETVLHEFSPGAQGCDSNQGLIMDKAGNMYGTTSDCGTSGYGVAFRLTPQGKETVLHEFIGGSSDGDVPTYGHLIMDKAGNLYGVTPAGGGGNCSQYGAPGCGVLYKLTKKGKLTVLHSFAGGASDGCLPFGTVAMDSAGNFYGTTEGCGSNNYGTVWEVSKNGVETILHNFAGSPSDGDAPAAGIVLDSKGNLYGNTTGGGANGYGTVWQLTAKGTLTLLHSFDDSDGVYPYGEVLRTTNGELFGTTSGGGAHYYGTVWSYVP